MPCSTCLTPAHSRPALRGGPEANSVGNSARYVWGFYNDTGSLQNLLIVRNVFDDIDVAARVLCDPNSFHRDTTVMDNDFHVHALSNGTAKAGVECAGRSNKNMTWPRIIGNRITLASAFPGSVGVHLEDGSGAFVLANMIDGFVTPISIVNVDNAVVRGNFDANGNPLP